MTPARPHVVQAHVRLSDAALQTVRRQATPALVQWLSMAVFIAGSVALPARAEPAVDAAKAGSPESEPGTAAASTTRKVSPYVIAAREHAQDAKGKPQPVAPLTMQRTHRMAGQQARK